MFKQQAKSKQKSERLTDPNKKVQNKQWRTFIDEEKKSAAIKLKILHSSASWNQTELILHSASQHVQYHYDSGRIQSLPNAELSVPPISSFLIIIIIRNTYIAPYRTRLAQSTSQFKTRMIVRINTRNMHTRDDSSASQNAKRKQCSAGKVQGRVVAVSSTRVKVQHRNERLVGFEQNFHLIVSTAAKAQQQNGRLVNAEKTLQNHVH